MYNDMMGMGEKNPKNIYTRKKTRKKFPIWFPSHPPSIKLEGFRVERNRKQAGPTLGGARYGSIEVGNMIFTYECSRTSEKVDWDTG